MTPLQTLQHHMAEAVAKHGKKDESGYGTCFQTALETIFYAKVPGAILCHASCKLGDSPIAVAHGYVTYGDHIIDLDGTYNKAEWQEKAKPRHRHQYTRIEAGEKALKSGHYGPWANDLLAQQEEQHAIFNLIKGA